MQPPPRLPSPPPLSPLHTLLSSAKSSFKTKTKAATKTINNSRPVIRLKLRSKPAKHPSPSNQTPNPRDQECSPSYQIPSLDLSNLPFQISRLSDQKFSLSSNNNDSIEPLSAGGLCSSRFASFSKIRKPMLNLESTEDESILPSASIARTKAETKGSDANSPGVRNNATTNTPASAMKVVKQHLPNLIGSATNSSISVKRPKCPNEPNFVKLNINGQGRKFAYKSRRGNFNASRARQRSFGRKRKKLNAKGEAEEFGLVDEEGLVSKIEQNDEKTGTDIEAIQEAISMIRIEVSSDNLLRLLKLSHGYDSFRDGQLEAIKMVLAGKSTMLVLPTGAGKSLCYQLPAMVLPGITLVVSPLMALMIDQLKQLPAMVQGGLLSSSQTREEASETIRLLKEGKIKVLFVSPERFLSMEFVSLFSKSSLISLLVVDEAHCISEWSHNFRPSYMRLRASLLRSRYNVECILAMTATATNKSLQDVMSVLEIPPGNLIQAAQLRDNLQLSISMSGNRTKDLLILLKTSTFVEVQSIIVYCKFQHETDLISKYLRDNNILAKSYHSGIPAKERNRTQDLFCANKINVVVATVAFGMGLNKRDVGAVIHYSLPESLEEYVQEIGRAGRDGRLSYCYLLFDDSTYFKLHSLMYSDGVDEYAANRLLCEVFCNNIDSPGGICSLVKEPASRKFDMKEEVILTILTRLELGDEQYLHLLPQINVNCTLNFHQTSPALLAAKDVVVLAILKKSQIKHGQYVFDIPTVANSLQVQPIDLLNHLYGLKLKGEVTYELKDLAYCYTIVNVPSDVCCLAAHLTRWLSEVESCKVQKLDAIFNAASFAVKVCDKIHGCHGSQHTPCLQRQISEYFNGEDGSTVPDKIGQNSPYLRSDIKVFLQSNSQAKFTPRAVARIMHGIGSPAFPSATWSKTHFWGRYMQIDFKVVMEVAKAELMNFVGKDIL